MVDLRLYYPGPGESLLPITFILLDDFYGSSEGPMTALR